MDIWLILLVVLGLILVVVFAAALVIFLEVAFDSWPKDAGENYDDLDDLDDFFRKKNYGD